MTNDEAVHAWAHFVGPVGADDEELKKLGLFNERMALESMQDDIDDGESVTWEPQIHEAYKVLKESHA